MASPRSQTHFGWTRSKFCISLAQPILVVLALFHVEHAANAQPIFFEIADADTLVERLRKTRLLNGIEIYDQLKLVRSKRQSESKKNSVSARTFFTANPYEPRYQHSFERFEDVENRLPRNSRSYTMDKSERRFTFFGQEPVMDWYLTKPKNTQVCAIRFVDSRRQDYELSTFSSARDAIANDFVITHRYHCGTCSSLRNLAVYLAKPDLTTPVRSCAHRLTLRGIKECLVETLGFEENCAETWTYNVVHTKRQCMATCIKHYGLWRVIRNDMGETHTDDDGQLNPCLACDEYVSGPGFQYAAGRTRRASGLPSAIKRPAAEIYPVDHSLYYK